MGKKLFPTSSRQSRIFAAITLLFVAAFAGFIITLILADLFYIDRAVFKAVLTSEPIKDALWLSIWTSCSATMISLLFAIPIGYSLSRFRFPGRILVDTIVDLPIVFPPLIAGITLLVLITQTPLRNLLDGEIGVGLIFQPWCIIFCQFVMAATYAIRMAKTTFDHIDVRAEKVALTLGCSRWGSFRHVSLPLAADGIISGGILTWARSFGLFGPLLILAGSLDANTEVSSIANILEQSSANHQVAVAAALLMVFVAFVTIMAVRLVSYKEEVNP